MDAGIDGLAQPFGPLALDVAHEYGFHALFLRHGEGATCLNGLGLCSVAQQQHHLGPGRLDQRQQFVHLADGHWTSPLKHRTQSPS